MSQANSTLPTSPEAGERPSANVTTMLVEQRPVGELARGSYVWPAWAVLLLAVSAVGLVVGTRARQRLNRKAQP